jgi:hypothetical protein
MWCQRFQCGLTDFRDHVDAITKQLLMMAHLDALGPVQVVADRLSVLYPDELSLRRLLGLAHVDAARIPFDGRSANMSWFAALEASRQGRLSEVVSVALEEYPLDPWLIGICPQVLAMRR